MTDTNYDSNQDYLEEDSAIPKQKFCCISFVEPSKEVEKHLEIFIFNKFLKHIAKNFTFSPRIVSTGGVKLEIPEEENPEEENKEIVGDIEESQQIEVEEIVEEIVKEEKPEDVFKTPKECHKKLFEEYIGFKSVNYPDLIETYINKYGNKTCIRGIKVRGSYKTLEEARTRAKELQINDQSFNVFVGSVGCWCPFNPVNINDVKPEYLNNKLNQIVHNQIEDIDKKAEIFNQRKRKLVNKRKVNKK